MITNPDVVIGLGDAGAHVALTMDAGQLLEGGELTGEHPGRLVTAS
jgi:hypothetical protein